MGVHKRNLTQTIEVWAGRLVEERKARKKLKKAKERLDEAHDAVQKYIDECFTEKE